jgi:Fe-S-cluster containining protein
MSTNTKVIKPKEKEWKDLDTDLITEEVCMQCGMCCKTTWWQDRYTTDKKDPKDKVNYLRAMFADRDKSEIVFNEDKVGVINWCSHLVKEDGKAFCGIYKNRPHMCRTYNCFQEANGRRGYPQYYDKIMKIIKKTVDIKD